MPPQSRGKSKLGPHSRSVPNFQAANLLQPSSAAHAAGTLQDESQTTADDPASRSSFEHEVTSPPSADDESGSDTSADAQAQPSGTIRQRQPLARSTTQQTTPRSLYAQQSRSQSYLGPAAFAPPFYNRPPTPLPPSPSLTSLLRPPFSAHPSRPTTPDSSDTEATGAGGGTPSTAAAISASARVATTVPRASPKVPTYEYYGFVLYLGSSLAFLMYLLWSYLPTPFLHKIGIYYYPDRWWSLAIPSWIVMVLVWIYVALAGYNTGTLTLDMSNVECLVDEASDVAIVDAQGKIVRTVRNKAKKAGSGGHGGKQTTTPKKKRRNEIEREGAAKLDWRTLWNEGTDGVLDVPIGGVCEVLYGASGDSESDDED